MSCIRSCAAAVAACSLPFALFVHADDSASTSEPARDWAVHVAGYSDATSIATADGGSTGVLTLNPILHVLWRDRFFLEAELENEATSDGERESALEYATLNWLINDHAALVIGKFLSPSGYFFQNLHPSWINKLPSVPAGFGHGGAAPLTDLGAQIRGGYNFESGAHVNYALYLANGPRLAREEDALDLESEGSRRNDDGKRVLGGRLGWMPIPTLELGASKSFGDVQLESIVDDDRSLPMNKNTVEEPRRDYRVEGVDLAWRPMPAMEIRAEWIRQNVGAASASVLAGAATWRAWYAQGSYRFGNDRWEAVVRLGDSVSPHEESTFRQTAIGLNYLISSRATVKLARENNRSDFAEAGADRTLLQFAYGF